MAHTKAADSMGKLVTGVFESFMDIFRAEINAQLLACRAANARVGDGDDDDDDNNNNKTTGKKRPLSEEEKAIDDNDRNNNNKKKKGRPPASHSRTSNLRVPKEQQEGKQPRRSARLQGHKAETAKPLTLLRKTRTAPANQRSHASEAHQDEDEDDDDLEDEDWTVRNEGEGKDDDEEEEEDEESVQPQAAAKGGDAPVEDWFVVQKIMGFRKMGGAKQYMVVWKGYEDEDAEWVNEEDVGDRAFIAKFTAGGCEPISKSSSPARSSKSVVDDEDMDDDDEEQEREQQRKAEKEKKEKEEKERKQREVEMRRVRWGDYAEFDEDAYERKMQALPPQERRDKASIARGLTYFVQEVYNRPFKYIMQGDYHQLCIKRPLEQLTIGNIGEQTAEFRRRLDHVLMSSDLAVADMGFQPTQAQARVQSLMRCDSCCCERVLSTTWIVTNIKSGAPVVTWHFGKQCAEKLKSMLEIYATIGDCSKEGLIACATSPPTVPTRKHVQDAHEAIQSAFSSVVATFAGRHPAATDDD